MGRQELQEVDGFVGGVVKPIRAGRGLAGGGDFVNSEVMVYECGNHERLRNKKTKDNPCR